MKLFVKLIWLQVKTVLSPDNPFQAGGGESVTFQFNLIFNCITDSRKQKPKKHTPAQHLVHGRLSLYICIFLFNLRLRLEALRYLPLGSVISPNLFILSFWPHCEAWDLSSPTRDQTFIPHNGSTSNCWISREVPHLNFDDSKLQRSVQSKLWFFQWSCMDVRVGP